RKSLEDFAALLNDIEVVGGEGREFVRLAGGPVDLDVGFGPAARAEGNAEIVLREEASPAANLFDLANRLGSGCGLGGDSDASADAGSVRFCAYSADLEPVAPGG